MTGLSNGRGAGSSWPRRLAGWLLIAFAAGLLMWDLDRVPLWALGLAMAAFAAAATLLSRPAR